MKIKSESSIDNGIAETKKKPRERLRKRLRPLMKAVSFKASVTDDDSDEVEKIEESTKTWNRKYLFIALLTFIASFALSQISISNCGFWATFEKNYNKYVYKDERWCYRRMESLPTTNELLKQVIGQEDAIALIGTSLELANREKIVQMAFVGSVGIGKTLSAQIVMNTFKWQHNIQSFIFDIDFHTDDETDFSVIVPNFSNCGFNLVVIDDVSFEAAERIGKLERRLHRLAKQKLFKIVFIVIFKENSEASVISEALKDFVLVEFQPLTERNFEKCIEVHEKMYNVKLKPKDIEELKFIDFVDTGCKTVSKKINLISEK